MLPRLPRNLRIALLVILVCCAPSLKAAPSTWHGAGPGGAHLVSSGHPGLGLQLDSVRYHLGDDLHWTDPGFDDQSWPIAEQARWPLPPFDSDGFIWVRARATVPGVVAGPMALCLSQNTFAIADELFVNGKQSGRQGSLPPHVQLILFPQDAVFDLPVGVAAPGTTLVVAFRMWYPPFIRTFGWFGGADFILDGSRDVRLALDANKPPHCSSGDPLLPSIS